MKYRLLFCIFFLSNTFLVCAMDKETIVPLKSSHTIPISVETPQQQSIAIDDNDEQVTLYAKKWRTIGSTCFIIGSLASVLLLRTIVCPMP